MPRRIQLSDLQLVVLANAAKRDDGHILPVPAAIANDEVCEGTDGIARYAIAKNTHAEG